MAARPAPRSTGRSGGNRPAAAHAISPARPYRRTAAAVKYAKKKP